MLMKRLLLAWVLLVSVNAAVAAKLWQDALIG